jgi:hypothetical protein
MKGDIVKRINFECHHDNFTHPNTYVNKLLFSSSDGTGEGSCLELWNIMSGEKIFDFPQFAKKGVSCVE